MKSAYEVDFLKSLGVSIPDLGCVMLDLEATTAPTEVLSPEWLYRSKDSRYWWVSGAQEEFHVTLLYGLLEKAYKWEGGIREVLEGWEEPLNISVKSIGSFPSNLPGEEYSCIIAHLESPSLLDAHQRLSLLPHINTHPGYKPHATIAYVHADRRDDAIEALSRFEDISFYPKRLNLGER